MLKTKFILAALLMLPACYAGAQVQPTEKPYIEVSGTAEKEVVPDEIYIAITLTERYEGRNKITIDDQERQLKEKIHQLGIDAANLSLSNADASYVKINWHNKDVLAKKNYLLKVANADMIGKVFQSLEDMNIKDASISRVEYAGRELLKKELRISAIKAAKDKAGYLLSAIDQTVGKPLYINDQESYPVYPMMANMRAKSVAQDAPAAEPGDDYIEFKKIKFTATVNAKFEIR